MQRIVEPGIPLGHQQSRRWWNREGLECPRRDRRPFDRAGKGAGPSGAPGSALAALRGASGRLDGLKGVAVGQFIRAGEEQPGKWSVVDVLQDQLSHLGVPVLGGLPIGHGPHPATVPLGTVARLDTTARTLTVEPGVS